MSYSSGVTLIHEATGPTARDARFVSYTAECSCGWRFGTEQEDSMQTRAVRELAEQHSAVCLG